MLPLWMMWCLPWLAWTLGAACCPGLCVTGLYPPMVPSGRVLALRGGEEGSAARADSDLSLDHSAASQDQTLKLAASDSEWMSASVDGVDDFRAQVVRLMVQAMDSFGFPDSARSLERESGIRLHDGPALEAMGLQQGLLDGDWSAVDAILSGARWADDTMRYTVYRHLCLELARSGRLEDAAQVFSRMMRHTGRPPPRTLTVPTRL